MNLSADPALPSEGYILSVAVPRPIDGLFTYKLADEMVAQVQVGGWVKVPFGRTTTHAFVVELPKRLSELKSDVPVASLKSVLEVSDQGAVFPEDVLALARWASEYYSAPLGEVLHCAAPPAALGLKNARKEARSLKQKELETRSATPVHPLNAAQLLAVETLEAVRVAPPSAQPKVGLLHGVTGSGKTEVYMELARRTLSEGKSVVLLVPEIALTSQLHRRLEDGLGVTVGLWHSAVADGRRRDLSAALRSGELRVIVGARSAVFAPLRNLGLIVVDEEHDPTYKQEDRVRYQARDLAIVRAKICGALTVLGSATPSLETRERVREGRYALARLEHRIAVGGMPTIELVDLCIEERVEKVQAPLARKTVEVIQKTLDDGGQVMVFLNRRGYAAFLICQDCGETEECPNCSISLTVHKKDRQLRCHVCGHQSVIPDVCQKCQSDQLEAVGAGTESLEEDFPKLLTGARTLRLDRDQVTSTTRLEKILNQFSSGEANLLLGTQMLVKGHDFPGVTLVVVVLADALFRWPDFRGPERALQILQQVSGRAGRGEKPGRVLIQTYDVDHPVIQVLMGTLGEDTFLESERELRKMLNYSPFGRMARIRFESETSNDAKSNAAAVAQALSPVSEDWKIDLLGPSEAFLERAKGIYRWDLLIKATDIRGLQRAIFLAKDLCQRKKAHFIVDVDPYGVG